MFNIFKCNHPHDKLFVQKEATTIRSKDNDGDIVSYYFICRDCGEELCTKYVITDNFKRLKKGRIK